MQQKEFNWRTKRGHKIYARTWEPDGEVKAVVCLVHGMGEHCSRYQPIAEFFTDKGYAVVTNDHFGHGKSEGKRGHLPNYEVFMDETARLLEEGEVRFGGKPIFLYGHSLGGNVVLNYLLRKKPNIKGVIATGPWIKLGFEPPAYLVFLGKITKKIAPSFAQKNQLDTTKLSHDAEEVKKYNKDPLVHDRITSMCGMEMMDAAAWLLENAAPVAIPLLLQHGSADQITSPEGTKEFAAKLNNTATLKLWDDWYHEIHNEVDKLEMYNYTLGWMESQF